MTPRMHHHSVTSSSSSSSPPGAHNAPISPLKQQLQQQYPISLHLHKIISLYRKLLYLLLLASMRRLGYYGSSMKESNDEDNTNGREEHYYWRHHQTHPVQLENDMEKDEYAAILDPSSSPHGNRLLISQQQQQSLLHAFKSLFTPHHVKKLTKQQQLCIILMRYLKQMHWNGDASSASRRRGAMRRGTNGIKRNGPHRLYHQLQPTHNLTTLPRVPVLEFLAQATSLRHKIVIMYNEYQRMGTESKEEEMYWRNRWQNFEAKEDSPSKCSTLSSPGNALRLTNTKSAPSSPPLHHSWHLHPLHSPNAEKIIYMSHIHPEFLFSLKIQQIERFPQRERLLRNLLINSPQESRFASQMAWMLTLMDDEVIQFLQSLNATEYRQLAKEAQIFISFDYRAFLENGALQQPRRHLFRKILKDCGIKLGGSAPGHHTSSTGEEDEAEQKSSDSAPISQKDPSAGAKFFGVGKDRLAYYDPIFDFLGITVIQWHMMLHVARFKSVSNQVMGIGGPRTGMYSAETPAEQHAFWMQSSLAPHYKMCYIFLRATHRCVDSPAHVIPLFVYVLNQLPYHSLGHLRQEFALVLKLYDHCELKEYDGKANMMPYLQEFLLDVICHNCLSCHDMESNLSDSVKRSISMRVSRPEWWRNQSSTSSSEVHSTLENIQVFHKQRHPREMNPFLRCASSFIRREWELSTNDEEERKQE